MHVHDEDVASENGLKENYKDYRTPFDRSNYAAAYDYVIKHYITDCYNLKFDKKSKYYNTPSGKPAIIVLCTLACTMAAEKADTDIEIMRHTEICDNNCNECDINDTCKLRD